MLLSQRLTGAVRDAAAGAHGHETLGVGMDLVEIAQVANSLAGFGERYTARVFTLREAAYAATAPQEQAERLAARFAAKEAALKALAMADLGVPWTDIEVWRHEDGRCDLRLHGHAAAHAARRGVSQLALSLTHDGNYAAAIVVAVFAPASSADAAAG
jgi:holo-[acyl-carrier protein] synthase